jgi:hypothetical protein
MMLQEQENITPFLESATLLTCAPCLKATY